MNIIPTIKNNSQTNARHVQISDSLYETKKLIPNKESKEVKKLNKNQTFKSAEELGFGFGF